MDTPGTKLTLTVDWSQITLERLSRLTNLWSNVIQAVSTEATGRRDALKWVLTDISFTSPLRVHAAPTLARERVDPTVLHTVSHAIVSGVRQLGEHPDRPRHFSTHALELMRKLALLSELDGKLLVSNGTGSPVAITTKIVTAVNDILGPEVESYGSVEGLLEGILTHGRRTFYVYDSLSGRQVRCFFSESTPLEALLKYFEHRVIVSGLVRSKAFTGEPKSIEVSEIQDFEPDAALLSTTEILRKWEQDG